MRILAGSSLTGVIIFVLACPLGISAQVQVKDTTIRSAAIANAIRQYHELVLPPSALYNGPEYVDYFKSLKEGQPFFFSTDFDNTGSVMYGDILYEAIPLKFDLVKDQLVTKDPSGLFGMALFHDKIDYFRIHGHTFVRIIKDDGAGDISTGFYDLLYSTNSISLLKKEKKRVMSYVTAQDGLKKVVEASEDFYIRINGRYYRSNTKGSLLNILKDKRTELKSYIRKNKLKFSANLIEKTLINIAAYYDSLKK